MSKRTKIVYNARGVDFTIYETIKATKKTRPTKYWVLVDYSTGRRRLLNNPTKEAAKRRADKIRAAITKGRADRMMLSNGEWQDACIAIEIVRSACTGDSLASAARAWVECNGMLGDRATLLDAVKFFLANHRDGGPASKPTRFVDATTAYHSFKVKDGKSESHCNNIKLRLARLVGVLPRGVRLDELTAGQFEEAVLNLGVGKKTRNDYRDHLQNLYKWAGKQNPPLVPRGFNPASQMEHHEVEHEDVEFPRVAELRAILAGLQAKRPDLLPLVVLVSFGALRPSEVVRLEWKDVGISHIRLPGRKSKTGHSRQIPLQENLKSWLALWRKNDGFVCSEISVPHVNAAIRHASGVRLCHDGLRHGFGTHRQAIVQNLGVVASEMGNSFTICRRHYSNAFCTEPEAREWFSIVPSAPANIISLQDGTAATA